MTLLPIVTAFNQPQVVGLPTRQIHDQGDVNCCVSCALGAALEAGDLTAPPLAPLYHFFFAGGQLAIKSGLTIAQAQGVLLRRGMCALAFHPFAIMRSSVDLEPVVPANSDLNGRLGVVLFPAILTSPRVLSVHRVPCAVVPQPHGAST